MSDLKVLRELIYELGPWFDEIPPDEIDENSFRRGYAQAIDDVLDAMNRPELSDATDASER